MREGVRTLVREGRLEFVNGGWVASDEACPTYEEILQNLMLGHSFLYQTFGIVPKHAWQIDSFGHSASIPDLFSQMGFESVFFSRIRDEEREERAAK
jgi:lysosomal alpha-mannosidase